jgi:hypothetical protein
MRELTPVQPISPDRRPYSIFGQRFITTFTPRASARAAAASSRTPSCIHMTFGGERQRQRCVDDLACGVGSAEDVDHVDRLRSVGEARVDRQAVDRLASEAGLIGSIVKPRSERYLSTKYDGRAVWPTRRPWRSSSRSPGCRECNRRNRNRGSRVLPARRPLVEKRGGAFGGIGVEQVFDHRARGERVGFVERHVDLAIERALADRQRRRRTGGDRWRAVARFGERRAGRDDAIDEAEALGRPRRRRGRRSAPFPSRACAKRRGRRRPAASNRRGRSTRRAGRSARRRRRSRGRRRRRAGSRRRWRRLRPRRSTGLGRATTRASARRSAS